MSVWYYLYQYSSNVAEIVETFCPLLQTSHFIVGVSCIEDCSVTDSLLCSGGSGLMTYIFLFLFLDHAVDPQWGQALTHPTFSQPIPAEQHFIYYDWWVLLFVSWV